MKFYIHQVNRQTDLSVEGMQPPFLVNYGDWSPWRLVHMRTNSSSHKQTKHHFFLVFLEQELFLSSTHRPRPGHMAGDLILFL